MLIQMLLVVIIIVNIVNNIRPIPLTSIEEKFDIFGTISNAVTKTPTTDPSVLIKRIKPAPESLLFVDLRSSEISIGFIADRKIRGNANKTKLPTKLPTIRLVPERAGRITG